jgi:hypothetical protein
MLVGSLATLAWVFVLERVLPPTPVVQLAS